MKENKGKSYRFTEKKIKKVFIIAFIFLISYVIIISSLSTKQIKLSEGEIARTDIKAPRDIVDEKATKEKEQQAIDKVGKQYTTDEKIKAEAEDNINNFFKEIKDLKVDSSKTDEEKASELVKKFGLTDSQAKGLVSVSSEKMDILNSSIILEVDKIYQNGIVENNDENLNLAKESVSDKIKEFKLENDVSKALISFCGSTIKPNLIYDEEKTDELVKEAKKSVTKVTIKKNQTIVKEGEPVTQDQITILSDLGLIDDGNSDAYMYIYIMAALFIFIIMHIQYSYIRSNFKEIFKNNKRILLIGVINIISLIFARIIGMAFPMLIPFACAPMLISLLIDYKVSVVISVLNSLLLCVITGFDIQIFIVALVNAVVGAIFLKKMQQRSDLLYSTFYISLISGIVTITSGMLVSSDIKDVLIKTLMAVIGAILSGILCLGLSPFLEGTFNEITTLKLLELANPNNELLRKLLITAPGTYHHSMLVANLAEMAAEEVGADSVVVRIGSYFHDIGKIERPYFFAENQMGIENPHNNIEPDVSAMIITSHVKDGIELAKKYKLPEVIIDIIAQHHGTTFVKYFYYTKKNSMEHPEEINDNDYRYKGPIPSSKEAGIVMLSDGVEAAVRSIKKPTLDKISEMIDNIIKDKLETGQLNNCDLTLKDIQRIKNSFLTVLNGIYHQRIEYPKDKNKK
ncbi:HDIG domain-containing metalloprotein [Clostridium sp. BJN0001]|uniref:HD family phosphohydrolase n=1 Tax=Clostridium sp. BJN0001 TaxID=2930219 RepID=UPI001FD10FCD|nr:HDIG domain-containing metalloprotein [Clostridium sp. BJN0001]